MEITFEDKWLLVILGICVLLPIVALYHSPASSDVSLFTEKASITDWIGAGATICIAILAGGQLLVSYKQASIASRQAKIMSLQADISEKTMTIGLRPHVVVENVSMRTDSDDVPNPVCEYKMYSYGETPAFIDRVYEDFIFAKSIPDDPGNYAYSKGSGRWKPIKEFKKGNFTLKVTMKKGPSCEEIQKGKNGAFSGWKLYFIGLIIYRDVFDFTHDVRFCYSHEIGASNSKSFGEDRYNGWKSYDKGNWPGYGTPLPYEPAAGLPQPEAMNENTEDLPRSEPEESAQVR